MEENLINLVECNYFTSKESEIISIINKKCSKDLSHSLKLLLNEIDDAINSEYLKKLAIHFDKTEKDSSETIDEIDEAVIVLENLQNTSDAVIIKSEPIIEMIKAKFDEIDKLEHKYQLIEQQQKQLEIM